MVRGQRRAPTPLLRMGFGDKTWPWGSGQPLLPLTALLWCLSENREWTWVRIRRTRRSGLVGGRVSRGWALRFQKSTSPVSPFLCLCTRMQHSATSVPHLLAAMMRVYCKQVTSEVFSLVSVALAMVTTAIEQRMRPILNS